MLIPSPYRSPAIGSIEQLPLSQTQTWVVPLVGEGCHRPTIWPRLFMLDAAPSLSPGSGSSAVITPFFHRKARLTSWLASHALPTTSPLSLIALALELPSSRAPKSVITPFSHRKACPASVAVFDQPTTWPRLLIPCAALFPTPVSEPRSVITPFSHRNARTSPV